MTHIFCSIHSGCIYGKWPHAHRPPGPSPVTEHAFNHHDRVRFRQGWIRPGNISTIHAVTRHRTLPLYHLAWHDCLVCERSNLSWPDERDSTMHYSHDIPLMATPRTCCPCTITCVFLNQTLTRAASVKWRTSSIPEVSEWWRRQQGERSSTLL